MNFLSIVALLLVGSAVNIYALSDLAQAFLQQQLSAQAYCTRILDQGRIEELFSDMRELRSHQVWFPHYYDIVQALIGSHQHYINQSSINVLHEPDAPCSDSNDLLIHGGKLITALGITHEDSYHAAFKKCRDKYCRVFKKLTGHYLNAQQDTGAFDYVSTQWSDVGRIALAIALADRHVILEKLPHILEIVHVDTLKDIYHLALLAVVINKESSDEKNKRKEIITFIQTMTGHLQLNPDSLLSGNKIAINQRFSPALYDEVRQFKRKHLYLKCLDDITWISSKKRILTLVVLGSSLAPEDWTAPEGVSYEEFMSCISDLATLAIGIARERPFERHRAMIAQHLKTFVNMLDQATSLCGPCRLERLIWIH